jgi:hypothetical protein
MCSPLGGSSRGDWIGPVFGRANMAVGPSVVRCGYQVVEGIQGSLSAAWMRTSSMFCPFLMAVAV